jgi:hypothetical protein
VKGIEKCCISIAVDDTDDNMLWKGIEEDVEVGGWGGGGHVRGRER